MRGGIEHQKPVFDGDALEIEAGVVHRRVLAEVAEALVLRVQIERDAIVVRHAVFELLAEFPEVVIALFYLGVAGALGAQSHPLLELQAAFGQDFRLIGVGEPPLVSPGGQAEATGQERHHCCALQANR